MELESVRALKQEIFAENLNRRVVTRSSLPPRAVARASVLPVSPSLSPIALGITGREGDYRLAVRIVRPGT